MASAEALRMEIHVQDRAVLFAGDLLLEQGGQDDRRGARILQALDLVQLERQGRSAHHQRMG